MNDANIERGKNALPKGVKLRQYEIDTVLGVGGFGVTYLAHDTALRAKFAIKEYMPNQFAVRDGAEVHPKSVANEDDYSWGLARFLQEGRELAKFREPNIVRVHQIFEENNTAYMVLDYEEGTDFREWLKALERQPKESELRGVLMPLLNAMEKMHERGLLHRDIAPDNIIMRSDGSPVLLDFGAAREAIGSRSGKMSTIVKAGYSPPEQYAAQGGQGVWTDIYALSATLYRAINGEAPSEGSWRATSLLAGEADPLSPLKRKGYSDSFIEAIEAGLSVNAKDRPQTVAAWRRMFEGELSVKNELGNSTAAGNAGSQLGSKITEMAGSVDGKKRLIGLAFLALLGIGIYQGYNISSTPDPVLSENIVAEGNEDYSETVKAAAEAAEKAAAEKLAAAEKAAAETLEAAEAEAAEKVAAAEAAVAAIEEESDAESGNAAVMNALQADILEWESIDNNQASLVISNGYDINTRDGNGYLPLHLAAARNRDPGVILALLAAGANIGAKDNKHENAPLHLAAAYNSNPDVITVLLNAGANIHDQNKRGATALHRAAADNGNPVIIAKLIEAGADVNAKNKYGDIPIRVAAAFAKNPKIISALAEAGADINAKGEDGATPLHVAAAYNENPGIVATLLRVGADAKAKSKDGSIPLDFANHFENQNAIKEISIFLGMDKDSGEAQ